MSIPNRYGVDPAAWAKFDAGLCRAIASVRGDPSIEWPVTLFLAQAGQAGAGPARPPASQAERVRLAEERQAPFEREVAGLVESLEKAGARDLQLFWINRSLGARMALPALEVAARRPEIERITLALRQKVIATTSD